MSFQRGFGGYALGALAALRCSSQHRHRAPTRLYQHSVHSLTRGNYFLTKNLNAGTCIVIGDEGVLFDMRGHIITGNGTSDGITNGGIGFFSMAIANRRIRNFDVGIKLFASGSAIISNVDSSKNAGEGIFIERCCNTLNSVIADGNGNSGIEITSGDSSLTKIEANGNGAVGIFITSGSNLLVASTANNNTGGGAQMNGFDNFFVGSTMQGNTDFGLRMFSDNGVIKTNTSNNGGDGMLFTSQTNQVIQSISNKNGGEGLDFGGRLGVISVVQANKNGGDGVDILPRQYRLADRNAKRGYQ